MKNEKAKTTARKAATEKKRPAPVGNGETAQGAPSQAANPSGEIEREEYKKFKRDISTVKAAFENALARCDACFLSHTPDLAETMASVAGFNLNENEIAKECADSIESAWYVSTIDMQIAVYEWLETLDMPKGALSKFKTDVMKVYHHPSGYIDGYGEKLEAIDTLNEEVYDMCGYGREYVRTEYKSRDYFRRLVSIARMACAANDRNATATNRKPDAAQGAANGSAPVAADRGGVADGAAAGVHVAGQWAIAHGVTGYNGLRFEFRGEIIQRDEKQDKRWKTIAAVIESTDPQGAANLKNWRGGFGSAVGVYKWFSRYIHSIKGRTGWYHLQQKQIKGRRPW